MSVTWKVRREELREPFASDVDALLAADPDAWFVTCGYRSTAEQTRLHNLYLAGGPKATSPGNSAHEVGLAVDVTLVVDDKDIWNYSHPSWTRLYAAVLAHPRLHSLIGIGDGDHIEAVHWRQLVVPSAAVTS